MRFWVVLGALAACGDNVRDPAEARSGDRLKLLYYQYEDGTLDLARAEGFHDAERGERCWPLQLADGFSYCAPIDPRLPAARTIYTDAACSQQLVEVAQLAGYAVHETWITDRFVPSSLVRIGALAGEPAQRFEFRNGGCQPTSLVRDRDYFEVGEEITRAQLAAVASTEIAATADLAVVVRTSPDGLHAPIGTRDRNHGVDCDLVPAVAARTLECRPRGAVESTLFHDNACTEPVVIVPATQPMPELAAVRDASRCATYHRVRTRTGGQLFQRTGAGCLRASDSGAGEHQYLVAEPIALPTAATRTEPASGRLEHVLVGDSSADSGELFDSQRGHTCSTSTFGDVARCLPRLGPAWAQLYADPGCTLAPIVEVSRRACDPPVEYAPATIAGNYRLYPIGARIEVAYAFEPVFGTCRFYVPPLATTLHETGPGITVDELAGGVLVFEQ